MNLIPLHIIGGSLAIITGFVALSARKGGRLHRKGGMLFVYAMLLLGISGAVMALLQHGQISVIAGTLSAYLVATALTAARPVTPTIRRLEVVAMIFGIALAVTSLSLGLLTVSRGESIRDGVPVPIFFVFGSVALIASLGDLRMIRAGGLKGARRIARHLWRMCFALWIASASFFIGPRERVAKILPEPLVKTAILVIPVVIPLLALIYWLWRVRSKRVHRRAELRTAIGAEA